MKVSAIFESTDHAEIAARHVREAGVAITKRRITDLSNQNYTDSHLPTDEFYFPAAAEFYTGMATPMNVMTPGMPFYPMGGHVETVVLLSHKKPDSTISVKVEFGEGEGKSTA